MIEVPDTAFVFAKRKAPARDPNKYAKGETRSEQVVGHVVQFNHKPIAPWAKKHQHILDRNFENHKAKLERANDPKIVETTKPLVHNTFSLRH